MVIGRFIAQKILRIQKTKESWSRIFRHLKERGLQGVGLVVSDDHKGIKEAITRYFQGALWQRCQLHFLRNLLDCVAKKDKKKLTGEMRGIFDRPDLYCASSRAKEVVDKYRDIYLKFAEKLKDKIEETFTCYHFPSSHRKRIRTTNSLERFNEEMRRRTRVVRIFPNAASLSSLHLKLCV